MGLFARTTGSTLHILQVREQEGKAKDDMKMYWKGSREVEVKSE